LATRRTWPHPTNSDALMQPFSPGEPQCRAPISLRATRNTLKLWSRKVWSDSVKETVYGRLIGTSDRSIIQVKDELSKSEGDRVRFGLRALPSGIGVQDEETLEGNEEGLVLHLLRSPAWREAPRGQGRSQPFGAAHHVQRAERGQGRAHRVVFGTARHDHAGIPDRHCEGWRLRHCGHWPPDAHVRAGYRRHGRGQVFPERGARRQRAVGLRR
jgi:hypothetical protein